MVNTVLADEDGTLWVGTEVGVGHYFPSTGAWELFSHAEGLDSNFVTALRRLPDGRLLAATAYSERDGTGLNVFDGEWQAFSADFPSVYGEELPCDVLSPNVNALWLGADETLWVGTQHGLGRYASGQWRQYCAGDGLPGDIVLSFMEDRDGVLWVGTDQGVARVRDGEIEAVPELAEVWVNAMLRARDGTLWFAGGTYITSYTPEGYDWSWGNNEDDVASRNWMTIVQDADGILWFGASDGGVLRYDGQRRDLWEVPGVPRVVAVDRFLPAPDGSLWMVASDGTTDRYEPGTGEFSNALIGDLCCEFTPYAFLPDGTLLGGGSNGLWGVRDGQKEHLEGLPSEYVTAVTLDGEGRLWVGTDAGVALVKDGVVAEIFTQETGDLPVNCVHTLFTASDGTVWAGLDGGHLVAAYPDGNAETFSAGDTFADGTGAITGIAETPDGRLWVTTDGGGMYVRAGGRWQRFESDMPPNVSAVAVAPDGSLWFAFAEDGVAHRAGARWLRYTTGDGLISDCVRSLYVSPDGAVWIGTDSGVARLMP
jgi:ligand-binding sensor domain-containing protein